jgi:hypothetical protein
MDVYFVVKAMGRLTGLKPFMVRPEGVFLIVLLNGDAPPQGFSADLVSS